MDGLGCGLLLVPDPLTAFALIQADDSASSGV
jgi:hypothetical protein